MSGTRIPASSTMELPVANWAPTTRKHGGIKPPLQRQRRRNLFRRFLFVQSRAHGQGGVGINGAVAFLNKLDEDRKSTRLNSSHGYISYAVFCLKKKKKK